MNSSRYTSVLVCVVVVCSESLFGMFFFLCYGDHRDLHVLTHSFPTRRSSDLSTSSTPIIAPASIRCHFPAASGPRQPALSKQSDRRDRKSTRLNSSH